MEAFFTANIRNYDPFAESVSSSSTASEMQGRYDLAEPLYKRSLSIREKALGPDHPDVGTSLNNLANPYQATRTADPPTTLVKPSATKRILVLCQKRSLRDTRQDLSRRSVFRL